eukprot:1178750-Prorocentrum_minimum.AAC.2
MSSLPRRCSSSFSPSERKLSEEMAFALANRDRARSVSTGSWFCGEFAARGMDSPPEGMDSPSAGAIHRRRGSIHRREGRFRQQGGRFRQPGGGRSRHSTTRGSISTTRACASSSTTVARRAHLGFVDVGFSKGGLAEVVVLVRAFSLHRVQRDVPVLPALRLRLLLRLVRTLSICRLPSGDWFAR